MRTTATNGSTPNRTGVRLCKAPRRRTTSLERSDLQADAVRIREWIPIADGDCISIPDAYRELRRIARSLFKGERPDHTLQPTALANEAYLRLASTGRPWKSERHFFGAAARAMKEVLIDHARKRLAEKRGGDSAVHVGLDSDLAVAPVRPAALLAVSEAVDRLARENRRQGRIVELRFYTGLTIRETARMLHLSVSTVKADWAAARAWLRRELAGA